MINSLVLSSIVSCSFAIHSTAASLSTVDHPSSVGWDDTDNCNNKKPPEVLPTKFQGQFISCKFTELLLEGIIAK